MNTGKNDPLLDKIRHELSSLTQYLDGARRGIEGLESAVEVSAEKFPEASRHLRAVTGELESAANNIMTILEEMSAEEERRESLLGELEEISRGLGNAQSRRLDSIVEELCGINSRIKNKTAEIFTSLSFHDLSGQKIKKVMSALSSVEGKILELGTRLGFPENWWTSLGAASEAPPPVSQNGVDEIMEGLKGKKAV